MKLSLVVPAYNEAKRIIQTLTGYTNFLRQNFSNNFVPFQLSITTAIFI
jgi:glycosyltransferase involved in cell wall biosynthesis